MSGIEDFVKHTVNRQIDRQVDRQVYYAKKAVKGVIWKTIAGVTLAIILGAVMITTMTGCMPGMLGGGVTLEDVSSYAHSNRDLWVSEYSSHLNVDGFKLTDVQIIQDEPEDSDTRRVMAACVFENNSVRADVRADLLATKSPKTGVMTYTDNRIDVTYTATKGIDFDDMHELGAVTPVFDEADQSCYVDVVKTNDYWFATEKLSTRMNYRFREGLWTFESEDTSTEYDYSAIAGKYSAKTGGLADFENFEIKDVDSAKGIFTVEFSNVQRLSYDVYVDKDPDLKETIHGTLTGSIEKQGSPYGDPRFKFQLKGSTNSGNGEAKLEGSFETGTSNESKLEITRFWYDHVFYTHRDKSESRNETESYRGTMYKND